MKSCKGCKHYKKDERTRLIVCEFDLHESYCEKDKEDFAIAELEKIKTEAEELIEHCDSDYEFEERYGIRLVVGILDNHISELKGENNERI